MAKAAEFFRSDGVIITGSSTGQEASPSELENVRDAIGNIFSSLSKQCDH